MQLLTSPAPGQLEIIDSPVPTIGAGELLVRLLACGVCGTDLMKVYQTGAGAATRPTQLGHELAGEIVKVGAGLTHFQNGQRVAIAHHVPDYGSHYSRRGSAPMDPHFKQTNIDPGGFAEFIRIPAEHVAHTVLPLPSTMPTLRAIFMEPLACCLRALDRAPVLEGDTVLVVGAGAVGMLFAPLLRDRSATVIMSDIRSERLELATAWGAQQALQAAKADVAAVTHAQSDGRGSDLVILTVATPATLELAINAVRDGGTILLFGVKSQTVAAADLWALWRREINLVSSYSATPDLLPRALALLRRKEYSLESMVSHTFPLREGPQAFALAHSGAAGKVVMVA
ncbi:MAG: alcohol dehydrogenase catalytic domain-containing protein [Caldilineaceae bacterium]